MLEFLKEHFNAKSVTKKESSDTGMAMVLIFLLAGYFTGNTLFYKLAIPFLVLNMAFPMFYYPIAIVWLGLTSLLGSLISKLLLSIVYIVVLMPVGIIRRMMGKDALLIRGFKKNSSSVMVSRDHTFTTEDILHPY
jgi:hypothetical protein